MTQDMFTLQGYHHLAECFWSLHVSRGSRVQILFVDLDLEQSSQCRFDYVQLYDGPNSAAKSLGVGSSDHSWAHVLRQSVHPFKARKVSPVTLPSHIM